MHETSRFQLAQKSDFLKLNPLVTIVNCDTVYLIVPFSDYVSSITSTLWLSQTSLLIILVPSTTLFVKFNLPTSISETTLKVQNQLLKSLVFQTIIHAIMLGIPNCMFIYAFFNGYKDESEFKMQLMGKCRLKF